MIIIILTVCLQLTSRTLLLLTAAWTLMLNVKGKLGQSVL